MVKNMGVTMFCALEGTGVLLTAIRAPRHIEVQSGGSIFVHCKQNGAAVAYYSVESGCRQSKARQK